MINQTDMYNVKNRSSSVVVYSIPESNLRRTFAPGESKRIPFSELEKLTYQPGGRELIANFLQIMEEEVTQDLNIHREPEYNMSEDQVRDLILNGSLDAFLDALDFAPIGVIDLIKSLSVSLPITDFQKRQALLKKTGFDVDKAIANDKASKESNESSSILEDVSPNKRRVVQEEAPQGRRTAGNNYKVINKTAETSK
jgi:hypothetical protein